jgi:hypothetical protein
MSIHQSFLGAMRRKPRARVTALLAALGTASTALLLTAASPANAETICSQYTNDQIWQTSSEWARVREQVCIEYKGTKLRALAHFQADWPSNCSLSVGLPPTAGVSCPASTKLKTPSINLRGLKMSVDLQPAGKSGTGRTCDLGAVGALIENPATLSCHSPWVSRSSSSSYKVVAHDVMGDRKDDGDGWKVLAPAEMTFGAP